MNHKIVLIIQREFNQRVRKRSFLLTTILTPLLFMGLIFVPILIDTQESAQQAKERVGVIDRSGFVADSLTVTDRLEFVPLETTIERDSVTAELLAQNGCQAILYIGQDVVQNPKDIALYSMKVVSMRSSDEIRQQVNQIVQNKKFANYDIENLREILKEIRTNVSMQAVLIDDAGVQKSSSSIVSMMVAFLFGLMMYMLIIMNGNAVMAGVIEEKTNRIVEVIISSVKPFDLMMGKIVGIGAVALFQFVIWVVLSVTITSLVLPLTLGDLPLSEISKATAGASVGGLSPEMMALVANITDVGYLITILGSFFLFFTGGYLLYGAMYAALGSAVDSVQDAQQMLMPLLIPLILSIVLISPITHDHTGPVAFWFSMIPLTSPTVMMARIPFGVPFWEVALSLVILYGSFVGITWVAAKIYRTGIFMYGKKISWKEIIRWVQYK